MPNSDHDASARLQTLTPRERERLAGILAMLSSPHDGERAAAGLLASAFVAKHGLAWADVVSSLRPITAAGVEPCQAPPQQDRRRSAGTTWYGYCRRRLARMGQALNWLS